MARLYLHCVLCGRKQADGLLSGAAWGRYEVTAEVPHNHPALSNGSARVCPTCIDRHPHNWNALVATALATAAASV